MQTRGFLGVEAKSIRREHDGPPSLTTALEATNADRAGDQRTWSLLDRARVAELLPARPSIAWTYGEDELRELIVRLMGHRGARFLRKLRLPEEKPHELSGKPPRPLTGLGTPDSEYYLGLQGFYSASFTRPSSWVLQANSELTKFAARHGGEQLVDARNAVLRRLIHAATTGPAAVRWGVEARLLIKGSMGTCLLFRNSPVSSLIESYFGDSDMDIDLLVCPSLPSSRWDIVFDELSRLAAVAVAELQTVLQRTGMDVRLAAKAAASASISNATPSSRWSFIMQPAFRAANECAPTGPPPTKGLSCVQIYAEVASFPGATGRPRRLRRGVAYASANDLHFFNGRDEVHFALFRCMLAFSVTRKGERCRAHAELLDISIPHRERSMLAVRWDEPTVSAPIPGALVLAPCQQLFTLRETIANAGQVHKHAKRCRRTLCLILALSICRGRLQEGTTDRLRALAMGATPKALQHIPADAARQACEDDTRGVAGWNLLACLHAHALASGNLGWRIQPRGPKLS